MTQPAISKQIVALEAKIGKPLFHRSGEQRFKAKAAGENLASELAPHIDKIEEIFNTTKHGTNTVGGTVYIGGLSEFIELYLSDVIASLTLIVYYSIVEFIGHYICKMIRLLF